MKHYSHVVNSCPVSRREASQSGSSTKQTKVHSVAWGDSYNSSQKMNNCGSPSLCKMMMIVVWLSLIMLTRSTITAFVKWCVQNVDIADIRFSSFWQLVRWSMLFAGGDLWCRATVGAGASEEDERADSATKGDETSSVGAETTPGVDWAASAAASCHSSRSVCYLLLFSTWTMVNIMELLCKITWRKGLRPPLL